MRMTANRRILVFLLIFLPAISWTQDYGHKISADCTKLAVGLIGIEYSRVDARSMQEINIPILFLAGNSENLLRKYSDISAFYMIGLNYRRFISQDIIPQNIFMGIGSRIYSIDEELLFEGLESRAAISTTSFITLEPEIGFEKHITERLVLTVPLGFWDHNIL